MARSSYFQINNSLEIGSMHINQITQTQLGEKGIEEGREKDRDSETDREKPIPRSRIKNKISSIQK